MANTSVNQGTQDNTKKAAVQLFSGSEIVFGVIKTHKASLGAKITDNYVENNFAIHDHIAFSPTIVTLSGFVGDLMLKSDEAVQQAQDELAQVKLRQAQSANMLKLSNYLDPTSIASQKLSAITLMYPPLNNLMQRAVQIYDQVSSFGGNAVDRLFDKYYNQNNATIVNRQANPDKPQIEKAYEQVESTFYSRLPNTVLTPWATYKNMYIQAIEVTQDELNHIIDLSVTFKQLKVASVEYGKVDENIRASYNADAAAQADNMGKARTMNSLAYEQGGPFWTNTSPYTNYGQ